MLLFGRVRQVERLDIAGRQKTVTELIVGLEELFRLLVSEESQTDLRVRDEALDGRGRARSIIPDALAAYSSKTGKSIASMG